MVEIYLSQEKSDWVKNIIEKIKKNTYLYPETFIYEGEIYSLRGEKELALKAYERALELNPIYKGIREYINYLRSENIKIPDISEYLNKPIPQEFLDFPAIILLDQKERIVYKDGSSTVVYHKLIKINKKEEKDKYGEIIIDYDSSFERVRIIRARTIKSDGKEIEATSIQDFSIASDYPLYTDQRQIVISMPSVEKDAILECYYMIDEYSRGILGKNFQDIFFFQNEIPTLLRRFGVWNRGIMPHSAPEIFKAKYGDCKDKAILLITMLKEAGIDAYYTLVSTRHSLPLKKNIPGFQFDHAIVAVPYKNSYIFLDGTAEDVPLGELPIMDQGADAMIIKDGKPLFVKIPLSQSENNERKFISKISIRRDKFIGETQIILTGYFATYYRWLLKSATTLQKEDFLTRLLNNRIPSSRLLKWDIQNISNLEDFLIIKLVYENNYLNNINAFLFSGIKSAEEITKEIRKYPIEYYLPYKEIEELTLTFEESLLVEILVEEKLKDNP